MIHYTFIVTSRPRHKEFCRAVGNEAKKNPLINFARRIACNIGLMVGLKHYILSLLRTDLDKLEGFRWFIVLTLTTIPDPSRPGQRVVQIRHAHRQRSSFDEQVIARYADHPTAIAMMIFETDVPGSNAHLEAAEPIFPEMIEQMFITAAPIYDLL